jgi:hypothetical protein
MQEGNTRLRRVIAAALLSGSLALAGCTGSGPGELLSTAELEEVQHNPDHARELYEEIVRRYPDSAEATKARERLAALAGGGKPQPPPGPDAGSRTQ